MVETALLEHGYFAQARELAIELNVVPKAYSCIPKL